MNERDRVTSLVCQAEKLVRARYGQAISLRDPLVVAVRDRSLVARCAVMGWDGVTSVVLKRNAGDDARGFTDWASLAFLSALKDAAGIAPIFYAGDAHERFVVMEDLGGSLSLADVLDGGDAAAVVAALEALATSMGRLIAVTSGHEATFDRMRDALPGGADLGRRREATRWLAARERVAGWAAALEVPLPRGFDAACARVAAVYADPRAYLAFSHGDPAPSNTHVARARVRLVDFEYAGYRHALYDITAWDTLCPLPAQWLDPMEQAFRRALEDSPHAAALVDERSYRESRATLCAYRALAMLTWFSPDLLAQDGAWTPGWTRRAALISTALRLHHTTGGVATLEPLTELGRRMSAALQARWPDLGDGRIRWPGIGEALTR